MCVVLPDRPRSSETVVFARTKAVYHARGNTQLSKHNSHGRGEIFAMSLADFKEKHRQGIRALRRSFQIQAIVVGFLEIGFQGHCLVEGMRGCTSHLPGQGCNPGIQSWKLEI